MDNSEGEIPENLYDVTANGHFNRAVQLRKAFVDVDPCQFGLYAGLELRNAIERALFEQLVVIHGEKVSKQLEKEYRALDLRKRIESIEPELERKIEYINLMLRACDIPLAVVPDLNGLCRIYGKLNNYLHAWKRPQETAQKHTWWNELWSTLHEAETMLHQLLRGTLAHVKLNEHGLKHYESWKKGETSDEEVIESYRKEFGLAQ